MPTPNIIFLNSASSIVVLQLNSGDVVYVRTHPTHVINGQIFSDDHSRTSFAGWKFLCCCHVGVDI